MTCHCQQPVGANSRVDDAPCNGKQMHSNGLSQLSWKRTQQWQQYEEWKCTNGCYNNNERFSKQESTCKG
eukprot:CAMPEP_0174384682 /NCGR_PEP_ID=MMETSP0811_2-20130205/126083_1 /TAXON_ID=73025 ORGANISM="Eutreptiella gymnastica-like, Strain CCMP1594" /NCGR_SAMPLE_ID=MMETSP0811_2 /ASSEMBLY_ACC=CAM_ASM_000667 /LENGTH=69 /DNA_ID=CAMNT_0015538721 /DNA_START=704 /DNA_END=913 /DNA_ORIENTATION=-